MAKAAPQRRVEIDERYIGEWFGFGLAEMSVYLQHYAEFAEWCESHDRQEQDDGSSDTDSPQGRGRGSSRRGSDGRFIRR